MILIIGLFFVSCQKEEQTQKEKEIFVFPEVYKMESDSGFQIDRKGDLRFLDSLYSGYVETYYPGGSIKKRSSYYQGKKEGNNIAYFANGDTLFLRPYLHGKKHSEHYAWHENGQIRFHYIFENGLSQGNHKEWYPDGSVYQDLNYVDGYELGSQRVYRPDGKFKSNYVMRENGRKYGFLGLKRCAKIDSNTGNIDRYTGKKEEQ